MIKTFFVSTLIVLAVGCSNKQVLNQRTIEDYKLTFDDLNNIQFYNSHDIVLTSYEQTSSEKTTTKGNLNVSYGKQVDQVVIKAGTRGRIVKDLGNDKYAVTFEADESRQIVFGRKDKFDIYYLQALEWKNGRGKIQYGDKTYYTHAGADVCSLRFKLNRKFKEKRDMRVAKGNKVR